MNRLSLFLLLLLPQLSVAQNRYEEVVRMSADMTVRANADGAEFDFRIDPTREKSAANATSAPDGKLLRLTIGTNMFVPELAVQTDGCEPPIAGILGRDAFAGTVLTIDRPSGTMIISAPYKPAWMPLRSRAELSQTLPVLDSLLGEGVVTFDFVRGRSYFLPHGEKPTAITPTTGPVSVTEGAVTHLTTADFLREVFDFRAGGEWDYRGPTQCVIDFWAPWCAPCLRLGPAVDSLAEEFEGKVKFYKIDIDDEPDIARYFGVTAIPLFVFIPTAGPPRRVMVTSADDIRENTAKLLE